MSGTVTPAEVFKARRAAHAGEGLLAQTFREAMRIWDVQKADGLSLEDRLAALSASLRQAWPQMRVWKYLCDRCDDTGLQIAWCGGDGSCGRAKPHLRHDYGLPCTCPKGTRFLAQPARVPDFKQAGKNKPPKGFTKPWTQG